MDNPMILHHYESSPYAEKIRLMLGYAQCPWASLISPAWPPRPSVDPLSGGYRRIPIAQIGADIFCDSALIAAEIATVAGQPRLDPANTRGAALELMQKAEGDAFFAAITSLPGSKLLLTMLRTFGPLGAYRFVKDRGGLLKGGTSRPRAADHSKRILQELFDALEELLGKQPWLGGDTPNAADFAAYHPIWLHLRCGGALPPAATRCKDWHARLGEYGHGHRSEITRETAFAAARSAAPRPLPVSAEQAATEDGFAIDQSVEIQPSDYGLVPVRGRLVAVTPGRFILARETEAFGTLHVHFPRAGYALRAITEPLDD